MTLNEYDMVGIPQFIEYFGDRFNGIATRDAYAEYLKFWGGLHVSRIEFSRRIARFTKYKAKLVSRKGVKLRVFVVQDGIG